ncbi:hypothetical protein GY632_7553 [Trichophyton interdigitale]|nr:hypothetical protein GY632_7553 [Trichophyton interdigitale]
MLLSWFALLSTLAHGSWLDVSIAATGDRKEQHPRPADSGQTSQSDWRGGAPARWEEQLHPRRSVRACPMKTDETTTPPPPPPAQEKKRWLNQ